ncbi:unnamed protein product [Rangifer tarandus platyrhynchus]|uniref:Uncharacterized protein n=2 Tax=Rangifer tarandus platyrhynchus TaxID=3082113 RepID=A0AC60A1N2_RANTA|nr:unnamed protein product [Rangifer tarandus platyrhynchus]
MLAFITSIPGSFIILLISPISLLLPLIFSAFISFQLLQYLILSFFASRPFFFVEFSPLIFPKASLVVQLLKNLPIMQETLVRFLGWEDLLEKEMATHSSILAWRIPWTKEPGGLNPMTLKEWDTA